VAGQGRKLEGGRLIALQNAALNVTNLFMTTKAVEVAQRYHDTWNFGSLIPFSGELRAQVNACDTQSEVCGSPKRQSSLKGLALFTPDPSASSTPDAGEQIRCL
jgi:hypothetical protein